MKSTLFTKSSKLDFNPRSSQSVASEYWETKGTNTLNLTVYLYFQIKRIQKGEYFGELALVTHKPRAASAYAIGPVKVACKCLCSLSLTHTRNNNNKNYK